MNVSGHIGGDDSLSENGQAVSYKNLSVALTEDDDETMMLITIKCGLC